MATWRVLSDPAIQHLVFDDDSARQFIADNLDHDQVEAFDHCTHPAMRADLFRLCFLFCQGGAYIDADDRYIGSGLENTVFQGSQAVLQVLCYDNSTRVMVPAQEILRSSQEELNLTFYVNNNPLIAPPQHPLIQRALVRATKNVLAAVRAGEGSMMSRDVQTLTGPGNLSAALVEHALGTRGQANRDFVLDSEWHLKSEPDWTLEYRRDQRNWRRWVRAGFVTSLGAAGTTIGTRSIW